MRTAGPLWIAALANRGAIEGMAYRHEVLAPPPELPKDHDVVRIAPEG